MRIRNFSGRCLTGNGSFLLSGTTRSRASIVDKRFVAKRRLNRKNMQANFARRLVAEFFGTAVLLAVIVGSGIMAERLANGNPAVALIANTIAIATALFGLILTLAPVSGAHFNPSVTLVEALSKRIPLREALAYLSVQLIGAVSGVVLANLMFELPPVLISAKVRTGSSQWLSEFIATFGLVVFIAGAVRIKSVFAVPITVAAYITAAIWFTSSTSFANPAVTVARSLSDTFTGIRLVDVPGFVVAQVLGAIAAWFVSRWFFTSEPPA